MIILDRNSPVCLHKLVMKAMDNTHEIEKRWHGAGDVVLWVVYFFWALWVFDALLPPKPEQTPFETYLGKQLGGQSGGRSSAQPWSPEARDQSERMAAEGARE
jgi:hypothetical protein